MASASTKAPRAFAKALAPRRASVSRRNAVAVKAGIAPIVGNPAPAFQAQAVYDQEFMDVSSPQAIGCRWHHAFASLPLNQFVLHEI